MVDLADNALTTLARVKEDLGIAVGVTTYDERLKRAINAASQSIESYCGRIFQRNTAITEKVAGYGRNRLRVSRTPLNGVTSIAYDGIYLASDSIEVDDARAGIIHVEGGVYWTAYAKGDISHGPLPGTERKLYTIVHDAGWVSPKQEAAMSGGPNLTFAATSPATITRTAGSWVTDGFAANLPVTIAGSSSNNGTFKVASVSASVLTLASGETLTTEGPSAGCTATIVRALPWDLEEACAELARSMHQGKGRDPSVTSESIGPWSASYNVITQGGDFPPSVRRVIDRYRRIS